MLFVIVFPISCKKMKHPSFLMPVGKRTGGKWWLGVGLGRCGKKTVAAKGVNLSWLRPSFCNGRMKV